MNESWYWIKQRPHFIAEYLAKDFKVDIFCEKRYTKLVDNPVPEGVSVNEIFKFPMANNPVIKKLNSSLLRDVLFKSKFKNASRDYDLVWLSSPGHFEYLKKFIPDDFPVVYDCMDDILEFKGSLVSEEVLQGHFNSEKELYTRSGIVFCSSSVLKDNLMRRYGEKQNVFVVNNAVHIESGNKGVNPLSGEILRLFEFPLKKISYIGSVSEWFDFNVLISALKENPGVMAVIVGPSDVKLPSSGRLHFIPPVNHGTVMEIMKKSDALIMPFHVTPLVKAVNPVKLYEYIYAEIPSISVAYPESEKFKDYVYLYRNTDEFCGYVKLVQESRLLLKQPAGSGVAFALQNTWEQRVNIISEHLRKLF